ncbi:MAG: hypothetical protein ACOX6I_07460 [Syntrophomonadaceae bacterium]
MENEEVKSRDEIELGTFEFLKTGWWIFHIIAIAAIFYLGYIFGDSIF